jgi:hypothetical protein
MIKPGILSNPTDVEGLRRFIALNMSNSGIRFNCRKSPNDRVIAHRRSIINRLEVFCWNFNFLGRFDYIGTISIKTNSMGSSCLKEDIYFQNLIGVVFKSSVLVYQLTVSDLIVMLTRFRQRENYYNGVQFYFSCIAHENSFTECNKSLCERTSERMWTS